MNDSVWGTKNGRLMVVPASSLPTPRPPVAVSRKDRNVDDIVLMASLLAAEASGLLRRRVIPECLVDTHVPDRYVELGYVPPRLVYATSSQMLYHIFGDALFYDKHPDYVPGGLSAEGLVIQEEWDSIRNYLSSEELKLKQYGSVLAPLLEDRLRT